MPDANLDTLLAALGAAPKTDAVSTVQGSTDDRGQSRQDKPHMSELIAALSSEVPGLGPAIHGGLIGGKDQALRSGGYSLGGAASGVMAGAGLGKLLRRKPDTTALLALLGATLGSGTGATLAARKFNNEQEKAAYAQDPDAASIAPMSPSGGALAGGVTGAALGGGAGLLKALLDSEDDTILSTLKKALIGAGAGGLGGAALGVGGAKLLRDRATSRLLGTDQPGMHEVNPRTRHDIDQTLRRVEVPIADTLRRLTGQISPQEFDRAVNHVNGRETVYHAAGSLLNRFAHRNDPSAPRNQPTTNP